MKLEGKTAVITGGGQGLGQGIAHCLAKEGADVAVIDINGDNARRVAGEVKGLGRKSLAIKADLTDDKKVTQAIQNIINTFDKVDILVNNVGGFGKALLAKTSLEFTDLEEVEWDENYKLNLKTQILVSRAVAPYFMKQKSGKIVNIASIAGKVPYAEEMPYGTMKASVIFFTKLLATELGEYNINVNCVCPGEIYTPLWEKIAIQTIQLSPEFKGITPKEYFLDRVSHTPLKRGQTPEDIGHAVAFLVSEDAKNITGQSLNVDSGESMN
ncbi:SDR family NAD(P)-dependent oxidoreductase [Chloroflexota bacterium]